MRKNFLHSPPTKFPYHFLLYMYLYSYLQTFPRLYLAYAGYFYIYRYVVYMLCIMYYVYMFVGKVYRKWEMFWFTYIQRQRISWMCGRAGGTTCSRVGVGLPFVLSTRSFKIAEYIFAYKSTRSIYNIFIINALFSSRNSFVSCIHIICILYVNMMEYMKCCISSIEEETKTCRRVTRARAHQKLSRRTCEHKNVYKT